MAPCSAGLGSINFFFSFFLFFISKLQPVVAVDRYGWRSVCRDGRRPTTNALTEDSREEYGSVDALLRTTKDELISTSFDFRNKAYLTEQGPGNITSPSSPLTTHALPYLTPCGSIHSSPSRTTRSLNTPTPHLLSHASFPTLHPAHPSPPATPPPHPCKP